MPDNPIILANKGMCMGFSSCVSSRLLLFLYLGGLRFHSSTPHDLYPGSSCQKPRNYRNWLYVSDFSFGIDDIYFSSVDRWHYGLECDLNLFLRLFLFVFPFYRPLPSYSPCIIGWLDLCQTNVCYPIDTNALHLDSQDSVSTWITESQRMVTKYKLGLVVREIGIRYGRFEALNLRILVLLGNYSGARLGC